MTVQRNLITALKENDVNAYTEAFWSVFGAIQENGDPNTWESGFVRLWNYLSEAAKTGFVDLAVTDRPRWRYPKGDDA